MGLIFQTHPFTLKLIMGLVFIGTSLFVLAIIFLIRSYLKRQSLLTFRLKKMRAQERAKKGSRIERVLRPLGELTAPKKEKELSYIRKRLSFAGYRGARVPFIFFGIKVILAISLAIVYGVWNYLAGRSIGQGIIAFFLLGIGYYLPNILLSLKIRQRRGLILKALPDVMDLLVVCVESGLSLDASLRKIAEEFSKVSPILTKEFSILFLEMHAGLSKAQALRNLADRNGVEEIGELVRVLIEAERFGTGIARTLRVYSNSMRIKRRQEVEEKTAKASVKLTFPLVFFILPPLLIIIIGPGIIRIIENFGKILPG